MPDVRIPKRAHPKPADYKLQSDHRLYQNPKALMPLATLEIDKDSKRVVVAKGVKFMGQLCFLSRDTVIATWGDHGGGRNSEYLSKEYSQPMLRMNLTLGSLASFDIDSQEFQTVLAAGEPFLRAVFGLDDPAPVATTAGPLSASKIAQDAAASFSRLYPDATPQEVDAYKTAIEGMTAVAALKYAR